LPVLRSAYTTHLASSGKSTESYRALIVDDDPDVLELAAELFRMLGYEVLTAENGDDAMKILKQNPDVDVLFTDVVMPGTNGIQLGYEARKLLPEIRVILVSGYPAPALTGGHGNVYDFDFLRKPYRLAEIIKLLAKP